MDLCPNCGERAFIGLGQPYYKYTFHCEICNTQWTMTDSEIYELSHPSQEIIDIVNKVMKLSYELAVER